MQQVYHLSRDPGKKRSFLEALVTSQTTLTSSCRCFSQELSGSGSVGGFCLVLLRGGASPNPDLPWLIDWGQICHRWMSCQCSFAKSHSCGSVDPIWDGMGASFICCDSLLWGGGSEETGKAAWRVWVGGQVGSHHWRPYRPNSATLPAVLCLVLYLSAWNPTGF